MRSLSWFKDLISEDDDPGRCERLTSTKSRIGGDPVRVVELTGEAGDIIIGHPWLLHASGPNCGSRPRIMRVQRVRPKLA